MFEKQISSRALFTILIGAILLTAAVLATRSMAGARESRTAFIRKEAM